MRKLKAWGLAAALALGLTATTGLAGDEEAVKEENKPPANPLGFHWSPTFVRIFHLDEKKPAPKKPQTKPKKESAKKADVPSKPAAVVDEATAERAREEAVLMRRLQVSDRLAEIAIRTNDTDLLHRAEALDERARTIYAQRTAYLRGSSSGFESDEKTIDKNLASARNPVSPGNRVSEDAAGYTVPGNDRASRAAVKEVSP
jgi:hypothetical protein